MKMSMRSGFLALAIVSATVAAIADGPFSYHPKAGFVPDETTAVRIAEAVLIPIYGQKQIESERPFSGKREGDVWKVEGDMPHEDFGGVAEVWIDSRDGRILRMTHGK
jgi:hypothetical protein